MKLRERLDKKITKIRNFFDLYTKGLNRNEIERLLKKDTVEAYAYLKNETRQKIPPAKHSRIRMGLFVVKEIFLSFIMCLSPARRFFYGITIIAFVFGLLNSHGLYIISSFLTLNGLLALELVDKLTTRDELEIARKIQLSLQPLHIPQSPLLSIAAYSKPAKLVGGDFFDIVQPLENRIISIVGDVSDKGVSAALYAAYAQSMFHALSETRVSPANIFKSLNHQVSQKLREGDFITAVIALFDLEEKSVTIARAGHNWPLYYCSDTKNIRELRPKGLSIGLCEDELFCDRMEEQKLYLKEGDFLLLYSDGVTEAADPNNRMFDLSGLKKTITENIHESSDRIIEHINTNLHRFIQSKELQDDATMVGVKIQ